MEYVTAGSAATGNATATANTDPNTNANADTNVNANPSADTAVRMPALGLGTYKLRGEECTQTVLDALDLGYRHIDTAAYYDNQAAIGRALAETSVPREEIFLTTKIWRSNLAYDDALASAR